MSVVKYHANNEQVFMIDRWRHSKISYLCQILQNGCKMNSRLGLFWCHQHSIHSTSPSKRCVWDYTLYNRYVKNFSLSTGWIFAFCFVNHILLPTIYSVVLLLGFACCRRINDMRNSEECGRCENTGQTPGENWSWRSESDDRELPAQSEQHLHQCHYTNWGWHGCKFMN